MEIVSEPEIRTPQDAKACLEELRLTLRYLGVSDCEMQEGSLRCDANVNIHIEQDGKTIATPIVEIKNLNSFRSVERAIQYEAERQYDQWKKDGKTIKDAPKQTRGWSDPEGITKAQREKETAADYRYFPEPDLVPVVVDEAWIARVKASIGELPAERRRRFAAEYGLSDYDANVLVEQGQDVADYYDAVARATGAYKLASNWVQQDILRIVKERKIPIGEFPVGPEALADLINRVGRSELNTNQGREVLAKMIETGEPVDAIIEAGGYRMVSDQGAIVAADRGRPRRQPQGPRRPQGRQEEARGRQGLPPRPGHEADRRQGRPRPRRRAARRQARRTGRLIRGLRPRTDLEEGTLMTPTDRRTFLKAAGAALAASALAVTGRGPGRPKIELEEGVHARRRPRRGRSCRTSSC